MAFYSTTTEWPLYDGDHQKVRTPDGRVTVVPVAATAEEQQARYRAGLERELAGVEHRLAHVDDPSGMFRGPTKDEREEMRAGLEVELANCRAELARFEPAKGRRK